MVTVKASPFSKTAVADDSGLNEDPIMFLESLLADDGSPAVWVALGEQLKAIVAVHCGDIQLEEVCRESSCCNR